MSRILYFLVLKPLSLLPLSILYGFSTVLYWILYKLIGYRTQVVRSNIERSFPDWSKEEVDQTMDAFYQHFFDIIVESVRGFSMSKEEYLERVTFLNPEVVQEYYDSGQSIMLVAGHYNNWELSSACFNFQVPHKGVAVYKRLGDGFLDGKLYTSRTRFGLKLIEKGNSSWFMNPELGTYAYIFLSDQSPTAAKRVYWTSFLNQDTAIFTGVETISKRHKMPVFFMEVRKVKRGFYEVEFVLLAAHPEQTSRGEIMEKYTRHLEGLIREEPSKWLWTHKRWKRKRNEAV